MRVNDYDQSCLLSCVGAGGKDIDRESDRGVRADQDLRKLLYGTPDKGLSLGGKEH